MGQPDPMLPPPGPEWFSVSLERLDLPAGALLSASGREAVVASDGRGWSVWTPRVPLLIGAAVRGASPGAGWIVAGGAGRALTSAGVSLTEQWAVALDLPLAVWEVGGAGGADVVLECLVEMRQAGAARTVSAGEPTISVADEGRRVSLYAHGAARLELVASGARLHVEPDGSGAGLRIVCEGRTPVRVVAAAAGDAAAFRRTAETFQRPGADPAGAWQRRQAQAARSAIVSATPDTALDAAFRWAAHRIDALLLDLPRAAVLTQTAGNGEPGAPPLKPGTARAAIAQLMIGHRDSARELIRLLASARTGAAEPGAVPHADTFLQLVDRYAAWTGDLDFLERHGQAIEPARRPVHGLERPGEPPPLADSARVFLANPAALQLEPATSVVEALVLGLWGAEPDAAGVAVTLRPTLPPGWPYAALRRLRVGRTVLDVELRRRHADLVVRVHRVFGPRILVTLEPPGAFADAVADEVELGLPRARFEAADRHEVVFRAVPS